MSTPTEPYRDPPPVAKGIAFFLVGLLAIHFSVTFLFNAPSNPVNEAVRAEVNGYMQPFFQQNWSLFAPNPINTEDEFLVRAEVRDADTGAVETTEWESATEREWTLIHHNPFPSRASRLSSNLHRRLNTAWSRLNEDQRAAVAEDFAFMTDWNPLADRLVLAQGGTTSSSVATMVRADRVATAYATQYARARWGDDVTAVQFKLRRTTVPRWEDREAQDPAIATPSVREFGWRPVLVHDGQDDALFATTIEGLAP